MESRSFTHPIPQVTYLIKKKLWAQVLFALFVGLLVGIVLGPETGWVEKETAEIITDWLSIPAILFFKNHSDDCRSINFCINYQRFNVIRKY